MQAGGHSETQSRVRCSYTRGARGHFNLRCWDGVWVGRVRPVRAAWEGTPHDPKHGQLEIASHIDGRADRIVEIDPTEHHQSGDDHPQQASGGYQDAGLWPDQLRLGRAVESTQNDALFSELTLLLRVVLLGGDVGEGQAGPGGARR